MSASDSQEALRTTLQVLGSTGEGHAAELVTRPPTTESETEQFLMQLDRWCAAYGHVRRADSKLRALIGAALEIIKANPAIFTTRGYHSFDQFLTRWLTGAFHLERTSLYECMLVARKFPNVTVEEFGTLPSTKWSALARVTDGSSSAFPEWLERARTMSVQQLDEAAANRGLREAGELSACSIVIRTNKALAARWKEMCADPVVQRFCETASVGGILDKAMDVLLAEATEAVARQYDGARLYNIVLDASPDIPEIYK